MRVIVARGRRWWTPRSVVCMDGLLLTDELVLLAYDDDGVNRLGSPHLGYGLAGAVLLVFPRTRYPSPTGAQPPAETAARQRMAAALTTDGPVDARTAALLTLTRAVGLDRKIFRELPRQRVKARIEEIAAGDWASDAAKKAIEEMQAALMVAMTAGTSAAVMTTTTS